MCAARYFRDEQGSVLYPSVASITSYEDLVAALLARESQLGNPPGGDVSAWTGFMPRLDWAGLQNARVCLWLQALEVGFERPPRRAQLTPWVSSQINSDHPVLVRWQMALPGAIHHAMEHIGVVETWEPGTRVVVTDSFGLRGRRALKVEAPWDDFMGVWNQNQALAVLPPT